MTVRVAVLAGEASGDALGGPLVAGLKRADPSLAISGIGGANMIAAGLCDTILPMDELSVMGLAEVLPRLPQLIKNIKKTIQYIENNNINILITVDAPDFSFRVHKALKKRGVFKGRHVHVVAPSVWAWRPGRARKISRFLDHLVCLFPFEPPYFERHGLSCAVMRHPFIDMLGDAPDRMAARALLNIPADRPVLGLMPGSRRGEIERHGPLFRDVLATLRAENPRLQVVVPTLPERMAQVTALFAGCPDIHVIDNPAHKLAAFRVCDTALAVSGTVGLEMAVLGIPHAIAYRMHPVTWRIVKRAIKTPYAHLANILLNRAVVPEFIQGNATAGQIVPTLSHLLSGDDTQAQSFAELRNRLQTGTAANDIAAALLKL